MPKSGVVEDPGYGPSDGTTLMPKPIEKVCKRSQGLQCPDAPGRGGFDQCSRVASFGPQYLPRAIPTEYSVGRPRAAQSTQIFADSIPGRRSSKPTASHHRLRCLAVDWCEDPGHCQLLHPLVHGGPRSSRSRYCYRDRDHWVGRQDVNDRPGGSIRPGTNGFRKALAP